jgi:cytochrome c peroxidase
VGEVTPRRLLWWCLILPGACRWSGDDLIDGTFNQEQWARLQQQLAFHPPDPCAMHRDVPNCGVAQNLAHQLFGDSTLTGAGAPVACVSCHDPSAAYIDSRASNAVSQGATGPTKRNSMTLLNDGYKDVLASGHDAFTWSGGSKLPGDTRVTEFKTAGSVLELAVRKPMASSIGQVAQLVRLNGNYWMLYNVAFGHDPNFDPDAAVFQNLEKAFDAYLGTFATKSTPFDQYLAGNVDAISDSARRGFAVFVGRGTCIECHSGPLFSDLDFHDTGVPGTDLGRGDVTTHDDDGKFLTGTLREIANTGPYMHNGSIATLADVIAFYRQGGVPGGYVGTRDPRIQPLDLSDQDAHDLEAFLRTLSQDAPVGGSNSGTHRDAASAPMPDAWQCPMPGAVCGSNCVDTNVDPMNCGQCGSACPTGYVCNLGHCG